ncbi:MAG: ROK family protein [Pseudomonadales bacterium]
MSAVPESFAARIGIDLGGTKISGAVFDAPPRAGLAPSCYRRQAAPRDSYTATLNALVELVGALTHDWQQRGGSTAGAMLPVGIGTPGCCLADTGAMSNSNSTWLNGQRLLADLQARLPQPLQLANDADCFALAQSRMQDVAAPRSSALLFGVILGTGVGGGWVQDGRLRQGPHQLSGEWGHTPLPYFRGAGLPAASGALEASLADRACYCGRKNCSETFLSGPGLLQTHQQLWGAEAAEVDAVAIAASRERRCLATIDLYCDMLARSLAQVVNTIDPDVIVLGGGLSNIALLYDAMPQRMPAYLFSRQRLRTSIRPPINGDDSGVTGAALLCGGLTDQEQ